MARSSRLRSSRSEAVDRFFPNLERERERARELFDIDIEASIAGWFEDMGVAPSAAQNGYHRARPALDLELTPRELEVLTLTACGYSKDEIGRLLHVSIETIKSHTRHIREKFRVETMLHAVSIAFVLGELDVDILKRELFRQWEGH